MTLLEKRHLDVVDHAYESDIDYGQPLKSALPAVAHGDYPIVIDPKVKDPEVLRKLARSTTPVLSGRHHVEMTLVRCGNVPLALAKKEAQRIVPKNCYRYANPWDLLRFATIADPQHLQGTRKRFLKVKIFALGSVISQGMRHMALVLRGQTHQNIEGRKIELQGVNSHHPSPNADEELALLFVHDK